MNQEKNENRDFVAQFTELSDVAVGASFQCLHLEEHKNYCSFSVCEEYWFEVFHDLFFS